MIEDMPRPRPLYLQRHHTRHGKPVWYVRKDHGAKVRIRGEYGTPEFKAEYDAAIAGAPIVKTSAAAKAGSMRWLYDRYRDSTEWSNLSAATRRQRENIFVHVMAKVGPQPFTRISRADIEASRDTRRATPAQARNVLDALRGLFRWAKGKHRPDDPTEGVANPRRDNSGAGFAVWTEADIEAYEEKWKVGIKERVWLDVLLYTGLRRGDAVLLGRQHVRDGLAILKTEKTGTEVCIPILPILATTLKAGPCGDLAFICGERGEPLTKESFGNMFSAAARKAGVKKSAHGVRKAGATRAAENGATVAELEAIFGWKGGTMAALYTRSADRRRLAKGAMGKLAKG